MPSTDPGHIPGPVVIPNCVQVRLQWLTPSGRLAFNVLHGSVGGGFVPTTAEANGILAGLNTGGHWAAFSAFLSTNTELQKVSLLDMRTSSNSPVESTGASSPGGSAANPLAPATALVITERTAKAGPGFRGRIYVPGWTDDAMVAAATVDPAAVTATEAWAADFPSVFTGQGITLGIAQPARAAYTGTAGAVHAARAAHVEPVTQLVVRNAFWDTQRRRGGRLPAVEARFLLHEGDLHGRARNTNQSSMSLQLIVVGVRRISNLG
jgi:hypothetical protein